MRDGLLYLHIVGVAAWLGGGLYALYAYPAVARLGPPQGGEALRGLEKRSGPFFGIATGLVLLSGIGLVIVSDAFDWTDAFVLIGIGSFLLFGLLQSLVSRKANERLTEATDTGEGIEPAVRSWRWASVWDFVVLAVVIWAMIAKLGS